jgi:transposase
MEAGTHSIWISAQLQELGYEIIVANVRELRAISHSDRKSDQVDAEKLPRYARLDPNILRPIGHRTVEQQQALTLIRAGALVVRLRTAAVNAVRGLTKSCGYRMPASATAADAAVQGWGVEGFCCRRLAPDAFLYPSIGFECLSVLDLLKKTTSTRRKKNASTGIMTAATMPQTISACHSHSQISWNRRHG